MKNLLLAGALAGASLASAASGATLDFIAESSGNERGVANGFVLNTANTGGLNVTLSATYNGVAAGANPYFDNGAALGVCHTGLTGTNQCVVASDDNLTAFETLTLAFDTQMNVSGLSFLAEGHGPLGDGVSLMFGVDGGALATYTYGTLKTLFFNQVSSITFGFDSLPPGDQYYLAGATVAPVPLPAAAPLLLAGLGALGAFGARRRRKAA